MSRVPIPPASSDEGKSITTPRLLPALVAFLAPFLPADEEPAVRFARPHLVGAHYSTGPRLPVAADLDGDGFADLACVYWPDGGILDVGSSERGLKMHRHESPASGLGGEAVSATARAGEIAWLTRDGRVGAYATGTGGGVKILA